MYFKIACCLDNPIRGGLHQRDNTNLTCLLAGAPSPGIPFASSKLNRGLNFVFVCLTLGTSLMAVSSSDLWVDGQEIQPGVKVLSGLFHMSAITDQHRTVASCHASLCTLPPDPLDPFAAQDIVSDSEPAFTTTLAVECKRKQADSPLNHCLGHVRPSCNADSKDFEEAAENTVSIPADSWMCWVNGQLLSSTSPPTTNAIQISSVQTWKISEQSRELAAAGLDSSILSPPPPTPPPPLARKSLSFMNMNLYLLRPFHWILVQRSIIRLFLKLWLLTRQNRLMLRQKSSKHLSSLYANIPQPFSSLVLRWVRYKALNITLTLRMPCLCTNILTGKVRKSHLLLRMSYSACM